MITHLPDAACWTVVQPVTGPITVEDIAVRLGGTAEALAYEEDDRLDPYDYEGYFQISREGDAWVIFEDNGYQGIRPEVLRPLSAGARVTSLFWNVNMHARLSCAVYGSGVTTLDPFFPEDRAGSHPHILDEELSGLGGDGDWQEKALAAVERITGISLGWPGDGPWMVLDETPADDPCPPSLFGSVDPDLDVRLRQAGEEVRADAVRRVVTVMAVRTGIDAEPAVAAVLSGSRADDQGLRDLDIRLTRERGGDLDPRTPQARRYWALQALRTSLGEGPFGDRLDALRNAAELLGDDWPPLRAEIKALCGERGPRRR
ncbi:DUF6461 domain-containing protein [Herbidospora cretacea]|uniref:DUF6461 domain-containing protein n=1 Tax=Herbidospora cretacea TaxID=28444 RepID=UPI0004C479B8|nr:DUF6461 domain-containing protein [Herbidospora cretacea]